MRKEERAADALQVFTRKLLLVARRYPAAAALMPSMHGRMQEALRCKGATTKSAPAMSPGAKKEFVYFPVLTK